MTFHLPIEQRLRDAEAECETLRAYIERHCGGIGGVPLKECTLDDIVRAVKCDNGQPFCEDCMAEEAEASETSTEAKDDE